MPSYRAYRLDKRHRIVSGEWLNAANDTEAHEKAAELCEDGGGPAVELWEAARFVEEIDCPQDD